MASLPTIVEKSDSDKTMQALQDQFKLSPAVIAAFKASKVDTLADLRFAGANEEEAGDYVRAIDKLENVAIMVARVRHMRFAIRQQASVRESLQVQGGRGILGRHAG